MPESASPTRVFTSISVSLSGLLMILGSADMIPSASVTMISSSAPMAFAKMKAVVSLPPLPRVVIFSSGVLPTKPAMTGMTPFSTMGSTCCWILFSHLSKIGFASEKTSSVMMGQSGSNGSK